MRATTLALAAIALLGATSPALANSETCSVAPERLRAMAAETDASVQRTALRNIDLGVALCEGRNRAEAAKKFNLAAKAMGTDLASVLAAAKTASVN